VGANLGPPGMAARTIPSRSASRRTEAGFTPTDVRRCVAETTPARLPVARGTALTLPRHVATALRSRAIGWPSDFLVALALHPGLGRPGQLGGLIALRLGRRIERGQAER